MDESGINWSQNSASSKEVLTITDVLLHSKNRKLLDDIMMGFGAPVASELRDVEIEGKKYSFVADHFGEGFPSNEDGSCWSGGGNTKNRFLLDEKLIIVVENWESEKGCVGQEPKVIKLIDDQTMEKVLRVIESIKY